MLYTLLVRVSSLSFDFLWTFIIALEFGSHICFFLPAQMPTSCIEDAILFACHSPYSFNGHKIEKPYYCRILCVPFSTVSIIPRFFCWWISPLWQPNRSVENWLSVLPIQVIAVRFHFIPLAFIIWSTMIFNVNFFHEICCQPSDIYG